MLSKLFVLIQYCVPQQLLSKLLGKLANTAFSTRVIPHFIKLFDVDMTEALKPSIKDYATFNDFFIRELHQNARPIDSNCLLCSPVDGVISQAGKIENQSLIQAKGRKYLLGELVVNDDKLINACADFNFATIYLSPKDYHRVHSPIDAKVNRMIYVPGKLFSVNDATTGHKNNLFARNERLIIELETTHGLVCLIMVGAMIVGNMHTTWHGDIKRSHKIRCFDYQDQAIFVKKGQELGHFKLGSTVILLAAGEKNSFWKKQSGDSLKLGEPLA